jgi:hypothetical protein
VELSDEEYMRRRLAVLWKNADLLGISVDELLGLEWDRSEWEVSPLDCTSEFLGPSSHAKVVRSGAAFRAMRTLAPQLEVAVNLSADGEPSSYTVRVRGTPMPLCMTPALTPEQAFMTSAVQNRALPKSEPREPYTLEAAYIEVQVRDPVEYVTPPAGWSNRWTLVWTLRVREVGWAFRVDAVSGELLSWGVP